MGGYLSKNYEDHAGFRIVPRLVRYDSALGARQPPDR
jgi:hypothetical protein